MITYTLQKNSLLFKEVIEAKKNFETNSPKVFQYIYISEFEHSNISKISFYS